MFLSAWLKKKKKNQKKNTTLYIALQLASCLFFPILITSSKQLRKALFFILVLVFGIRKDFQTVICYSLITGLIMKSNFVKFCQMLSTDFKDNPKKSIALIFWIINSQILSCISVVKPHLIIYCFCFFFLGKKVTHSTWIMHLSKIHVGSNFDQMHKQRVWIIKER